MYLSFFPHFRPYLQVQTNQQIPQSISQSLYFARNPRFRRVGSQDSQSSVSSGGGLPSNVAEEPTTRRKPVSRSTSGVTGTVPSVKQSTANSKVPTNQFFPVDSTQIRITRNQLRPMQHTAAANPHQTQQQQKQHQQQQQQHLNQQYRMGGSSQYRQRSVQPVFRNDLTSIGGPGPFNLQNLSPRADTPSTAVESLTDSEIVLPPPIQFRS